MYHIQQLMKHIFSLIPELVNIPRELYQTVANIMSIKTYATGELLINDDDKHPDAFIIGQGAFYSCLPKENPKVIIKPRGSHIGGINIRK